MFQISTEETYQDGQIIFEEGNSGDWVYIIQSGAVELYRKVGEKKVVVAVLQPGDIFGEIAFIAKIPRTASACAVGLTSVGIIDRTFLDQEYNGLSGSFHVILKSIALRFEKTIEKALHPTLRRKDPRLPEVLSLSFKSSAGFVKAFSGDMSASGIFIKTNNPLAKGKYFILKLQLPDVSEALKISCEVAWNRNETSDPVNQPKGMGIKFTEISPADHQKMKEALIRATR
ncbi:MAG: cyclic nucleotide-binding domain-containing protein [Deltaproteobacteria bacterium]|nr:cyclic nucleotide-binding domain-containing protein [Deltaproteobacteria bacterium]